MWSTEGVTLIATTDDYTLCQSMHMTSFSVLLVSNIERSSVSDMLPGNPAHCYQQDKVIKCVAFWITKKNILLLTNSNMVTHVFYVEGEEPWCWKSKRK